MFCILCGFKFCPEPCKTAKISTAYVVSKSLRKPMTNSNVDVVFTFKRIVFHWPMFQNFSLFKCHPFFLQPLKNLGLKIRYGIVLV